MSQKTRFFGLRRLFGKPKRQRARLRIDRTNTVLYAIGDVHGCLEELLRLEDMIYRDAAEWSGRKFIVMLGDYIDRGPRSAEVLDHLIAPARSGFHRICLCGNHEEMMLRFLQDPQRHRAWLDAGGEATMASYQVDMRHVLKTHRDDDEAVARVLAEAVPARHLEFMDKLPALICDDRVALVHAGLRPGIDVSDQSDQDLLWIREPFLSKAGLLPIFVVHGHTQVNRVVPKGKRIGIDTGVHTTGRLTALRLFGERMNVLAVSR